MKRLFPLLVSLLMGVVGGHSLPLAHAQTLADPKGYQGEMKLYGSATEPRTLELALPPGKSFGRGIALKDRMLAVAAYDLGENGRTSGGAVFVFCFSDDAFSNPVLTRVIRPAANQTLMGFALAASESLLAVATYAADASRVLLFSHDGCRAKTLKMEQVTFPAVEKELKFAAVYDVSLDGNRLAVSETASGSKQGAVHAFSISLAGKSVRRLTSIGPGLSCWKPAVDGTTLVEGFGHAVSLRGNTLLVGAHRQHGLATTADQNFGAVYTYRFKDNTMAGCEQASIFRTGAAATSPFIAVALKPGDLFGASVKWDGTSVVVGAPGDDGAGPGHDNHGAVHVMTVNPQDPSKGCTTTRIGRGWKTDVAADKQDRFGYALSLDKGRLAVGAPATDSVPPVPGKVFLFPVIPAAQAPCGTTTLR